MIGQYKRGSHFQGETIAPHLRDVIEARRVKNVIISSEENIVANIDGECFESKHLEIEVVEKAVDFVIPSGIKL